MVADDTLHTYPVGDLIEHEMSEDCICGPEIEPVKRDDGSIAYLVSHHSLDGRERLEAD